MIAGRYRPIRLLGRGGAGTVYEVEHIYTRRRLAMKILFRAGGEVDLARFGREAQALSRLDNDHVVRITDAEIAHELGGAPFIVMELLRGCDLEKASHRGPVSAEKAIEWLGQVAHGLDAAHAAGIVHRDLKPQNLFLAQGKDGQDVVKIVDFGISEMASEGDKLTRSEQLLGTPTYMAPEQADKTGAPLTRQADLYTLGLVTFRLLVGRTYWRTGTLSQVLAQLLTEPMAAPSDLGVYLGDAFDAWFLRACHREPEKRFGSAREQIEALTAALATPSPEAGSVMGDPTPSSTPLVSSRARPSRLRRRPQDWVGAATALALMGALAAIGKAIKLRSGVDPADGSAPTHSPSEVIPPNAATSDSAHSTGVGSTSVIGLRPVDAGDNPPALDPGPQPASTKTGRRPPSLVAPSASRSAAARPSSDPLEGQF